MSAAVLVAGCSGSGAEPVRVEFMLKSSLLGCGQGSASGELRFFVSGLRMVNGPDTAAPVLLDATPTQSEGDGIALISWTGNCAQPARAVTSPDAANTSPSNPAVTGRVKRARYDTIEFELGVPFALNHANPLTAPAPLNVPSMFWTWQTGYKFLRLDIGTDWSLHLGSTGCVSESAVRPPGACEEPNVATIRLPAAAALGGTVIVDLDTLLAEIDFANAGNCVDAYRETEDCHRLLSKLGIDADTGRCIDDCRRQTLFRYDDAES